MKAMTFSDYGPPDVLTMSDVSDPHPGQRQLLIEVHGSSTNPVDCKLRAGKFRMPVELPIVPGCDVCGRVAGVGGAVRKFKEDDWVYASPPLGKPGAHASHVVVDERAAAEKPESLDALHAGVLRWCC